MLTAKQIKDHLSSRNIYEKEAFVLLVSKYIYLEDKEAKLAAKSRDETTEEEKRQEDKLKDLTLANVNKQLEPFLNNKLRVKRTRKTSNGTLEEYKEVVTVNNEMSNIADIWNKSDAETRNRFLDNKIGILLRFKKKYSIEDIQSAIRVEVAHMQAPIVASSAEAIRRIRPSSRNLFTELADPSTLNTLERLNAFIEEKYHGKLGDEGERTIPTGQTIGRYLKPYKDYTFTDFRCMHSEGSNSDCLIHSFLTATCPAFRRLTSRYVSGGRGTDKNEFATWFRDYVYPAMPAVQRQLTSEYVDMRNKTTTGLITHQRIFTPGTFLSDTDIGLLCEVYNQNIMSFQGPIVVGEQSQDATVFTATAAGNPDTPFIIISNASGSHFEAVQTSEGRYTIPSDVANQIIFIINEQGILQSIPRGQSNVRDRTRRQIYAAKVALRRPPNATVNDRKTFIAKMMASNTIRRRRREGNSHATLKAAAGKLWNNAQTERPAAAAAAKAEANVNINDRPTYIGKMLKSEAANEFRAAGLNDATLEEQYGQAWNNAQKERPAAAAARAEQEELNAALARSLAEGGGMRRSRSLRLRRRHTSKAKGHGRRTRKHKS